MDDASDSDGETVVASSRPCPPSSLVTEPRTSIAGAPRIAERICVAAGIARATVPTCSRMELPPPTLTTVYKADEGKQGQAGRSIAVTVTRSFGAPNTGFPLLVFGNTMDPGTPLVRAMKIGAAFPRAGLLTVDSPGHTSTAVPSTCVYEYLRAYFRNGTLPAAGAVCTLDSPIFLTTGNSTQTGGAKRGAVDDIPQEELRAAACDTRGRAQRWGLEVSVGARICYVPIQPFCDFFSTQS
ncbi:TAP-like protein-domain-containing protein [Mycena maculata]|uniref:TAP-like protein-domain-containing protein n=1 Tax=Mycena maculata TaxID=230809 RepID=A0AAD7IKJ9_9AGAR|nr:TAP-like protein-domain-containing protein [Mycena maculata]